MDELRKIRKKIIIRILFVVAGAAAVAAVFLLTLRISTVTVEGNEWYSDGEIEALVFPDDWSRNPLAILFGEKQDIPFVEKYTVNLTGIRSAEIIVYEKGIIGCVSKMGSYMYFDSDGYVVESSSVKMDNVPEVSGLATDYIVLGDRLPMEEDDIFQEVLNVTQYLQSKSITWQGEEVLLVSLVDVIRLDSDGNVTCIFGDISVYLGGNKDMEEKLLEMASILPELVGRSGTLYLDAYDPTADSPAYVFK